LILLDFRFNKLTLQKNCGRFQFSYLKAQILRYSHSGLITADIRSEKHKLIR